MIRFESVKTRPQNGLVMNEKSNMPSNNLASMTVAKFTKIEAHRDEHNDLLYIHGISDLQRDRLIFMILNSEGEQIRDGAFQTKLDGTWGPVTTIILQKFSPQKFTLRLREEGNNEILDEQDFEWKGFEKTKTKDIHQELLNPQPRISIADLIEKFEKSLRKVVFEIPKKEFDIHNAVEQLLAGTHYENKFSRDSDTVVISGRTYKKPDFVFDELNLALEVKLCNSKDDAKKIIEEMNADIIPYTKKYEYVIFLVYDLGFILDVDDFVSDYHNRFSNIRVVIVKH